MIKSQHITKEFALSMNDDNYMKNAQLAISIKNKERIRIKKKKRISNNKNLQHKS